MLKLCYQSPSGDSKDLDLEGTEMMDTTTQAVLFTIPVVLGLISGVLLFWVGMSRRDLGIKLGIPMVVIGLITTAFCLVMLMHVPMLYP